MNRQMFMVAALMAVAVADLAGKDNGTVFFTVTEEDVLAGRPVTGTCRLRRLVSKSGSL